LKTWRGHWLRSISGMADIDFIPHKFPAVQSSAPQPVLPPLGGCALLFDIDGTLLDLAPTPDAVVVPKGLRSALHRLFELSGGALAFVSGRSIVDIDRIFAPMVLPAVGGHGAEMRVSPTSEACAIGAQPMSRELKRRFAAIGDMSERILIEDKGYSIAIHYRQALEFEHAIFARVAAIRSDLSEAPIDVLPGKRVVEIKPSGFSKASGVRELMLHDPFKQRRPVFFGDDVTDDSVFAIMPDLAGLSFSVGRKARGVAGQFGRPRDVRRWLTELAGRAEAPTP
jgi:trehalose 6-phosphate phosphatase